MPRATVSSRKLTTLLAGLMLFSGLPAAAGDADEPSHWSLAPIVRPAVPDVKRSDWPAGEIDRFILAQLEENSMEPAARVSRQKLIRRVYFDLVGLPPTPEEVQAFVADESPQAYERLVDRLLASPHYGERWARYWLDLVRFAETNGYERDAVKPHAWKYRDWVIEALNDDLAYDRFVLEQLAGDELLDRNEQTLVATGMLRVGTFDDEPNDPLQYKYEQLDDLVHVTSTAFLGLTVRCARCHDHKFDPIPQTDYYAMVSFFIGGQPAPGEVLGYTDAAREAPAVKLLRSGDPRAEADVVPPHFLSCVAALARDVEPPSPEATTTGRRTQLARWIVDPKNPLAARVFVNRLWQHHFGEGLVRSPDNFGVMGSEPTHPELLDWLAADFMEQGWRIKRLHRMILLSSTYQMDSTHPRGAEYAARDFANEHWWRASRLRLDAEALRDAMLAVSGQLNLAAGGPSFLPKVTAEALEGLSMKAAAWKESPPEEQRRRSIYMFTKRSLLWPLMTVFDFADTTQPCGRRDSTIVAPQALALLNNEFVHEQSDALATRLAREAPADSTAQIERAWWLALGRAPSEHERQVAGAHLAAQAERFLALKPPTAEVAGGGAAEAQATAPAVESAATSAERARHLALASLCHVLLNANEFLFVD